MPWQATVLIGLFALNALLTILLIGRPRPPITPTSAVVVVCITVLESWLAWSLVR